MNELAPRKTSPKTNTQNKQNQNKLPYIQVEAVEAVRKAWGSLYDLVDDAENLIAAGVQVSGRGKEGGKGVGE